MEDKCCKTCEFYNSGFCVVPLYVNSIKINGQRVLATNFCHLWEKKEVEQKSTTRD